MAYYQSIRTDTRDVSLAGQDAKALIELCNRRSSSAKELNFRLCSATSPFVVLELEFKDQLIIEFLDQNNAFAVLLRYGRSISRELPAQMVFFMVDVIDPKDLDRNTVVFKNLMKKIFSFKVQEIRLVSKLPLNF